MHLYFMEIYPNFILEALGNKLRVLYMGEFGEGAAYF